MGVQSVKAVHTGEHIIIAGLVVQLVFFCIFLTTVIHFHRRMMVRPTAKATLLKREWTPHIWVVYLAALLVLIRSVYRVVEYTSSRTSSIQTHEAFFYSLDLLLMFIVMAVMSWIHPSKIYVLQRKRGYYVELGVRLKTLEARDTDGSVGGVSASNE
jgi:hypothetical protein